MKKRRLFAGFAAAVMAAFSLPMSMFAPPMTAYAAGDDIQAVFGNASGDPGEQVQITFSIPKNTGFRTFDVAFSWDKDQLSLVNMDPDPTTDRGYEALDDLKLPDNGMEPIWEFDLDTGEIYYGTVANRGQYRVALGDGGARKLYTATATNLITFTFEISPNAKPGDIQLNVYEHMATLLGDTETTNIAVTGGKITVSCLHNSDLVSTAAKPADCDVDGYDAYYTCPDCGQLFKDASGNIPIDKPVVRPATDHDYGDVVYEWSSDYKSCTATKPCNNNHEHDITETVETKATKKDASCTVDGMTTYTATFTNKELGSASEEVLIPATDHTWKLVGYDLDKEALSCTANLKCEVCNATDTAVGAVARNTIPVNHCQDGYIEYTATFGDKRLKENERTYSERDIIPSDQDHNWTNYDYVWVGFTECTATRECSVCHTTDSETATVANGKITTVVTDSTCTEAGSTAYTATFTKSGFEKQEKVDNTKPERKNHAYGEVTYEFNNDDDNTCTATRVCKNDPKHVIEQTVKPTSEITKPASCSAEGERKYTWTFTGEGLGSTTKTEKIDKLPHTEATRYDNIETGKLCDEERSADLVTYCTECQEVLYSEPATLPKGTHAFETIEEDRVEPSCTVDGKVVTVDRCKQCGYVDESTRATETLKATDHVEGRVEHEDEKEATCEENGSYNEVVYCANCGEAYQSTPVTTKPLGHDTYEEQVIVDEPTCTEPGSYDLVEKCTRCDHSVVLEEGVEMAAKGHEAGEPVRENEIAATEDKDGSYDEVVYCKHCKEELSRETKTIKYGEDETPDTDDPSGQNPGGENPGGENPGGENPGQGDNTPPQTGAAAGAAGAIALLVAALAVTAKKRK